MIPYQPMFIVFAFRTSPFRSFGREEHCKKTGSLIGERGQERELRENSDFNEID